MTHSDSWTTLDPKLTIWEDLDSEEPLCFWRQQTRLIDLQLWTWDPKKNIATLLTPKMGREVSEKKPKENAQLAKCRLWVAWRMAPALSKWLVSLDEPYLGDLLTMANGMIFQARFSEISHPSKDTSNSFALGSLLDVQGLCGVPKDWPVKMVETPCWVPRVAYQKSMLYSRVDGRLWYFKKHNDSWRLNSSRYPLKINEEFSEKTHTPPKKIEARTPKKIYTYDRMHFPAPTSFITTQLLWKPRHIST